MIRQNDRNFIHSELAQTDVNKNPVTGVGYRDESLSNAEILSGNRFGKLVNFAKIINQYRYLLGSSLKMLNNSDFVKWSQNLTYTNGAVVTHNHKIYISLNSNNMGNEPGLSENWVGVTDFLENEYLKIDLSNGSVSGSGNQIALQNEPQLINPDVTTQPDGTSNTKAASCEFVQNIASSMPTTYSPPWVYMKASGETGEDYYVAARKPSNLNINWTDTGSGAPRAALAMAGINVRGGIPEFYSFGFYDDFLQTSLSWNWSVSGNQRPSGRALMAGVFDTSENPLVQKVEFLTNPPTGPVIGADSLLLLTTGDNFD